MATESSAVVRFIDLAQQARNPVLPTQPAPITSEFGTEVLSREVRSKSSRLPLILGAVVLAGGAAAAGVFFGKGGFGGSDGSDKADAPAKAAAAAPLAAADREQATPAAPAVPEAPAPAAAPAAPEPQVTAPAVTAASDVLAATGFDIRVEPGATITLDGSVLGKAPLRVRNLQAGAHTVDIEAPPGYFSRRVELVLAAGEAKDLRLSLDAIEGDKPAVATLSDDDQPKAKAKSSRRERAEARRERKEKAREEAQRKKEMRAARAAAARSAKKSTVVAEPLKDAPAARKDEKMDAADAELEAAMAEITGKPVPKRSGSTASAAGASSLAASEPAAISGKGTLMLGSKPPCDIILDGKPTGLKTPQRAMELSAGTHSVTLVNPELGIEKKFKVKIAPGKTTKAIQDLTDKLD